MPTKPKNGKGGGKLQKGRREGQRNKEIVYMTEVGEKRRVEMKKKKKEWWRSERERVKQRRKCEKGETSEKNKKK